MNKNKVYNKDIIKFYNDANHTIPQDYFGGLITKNDSMCLA